MTYVFDTSGLIRMFKGEAGGTRVRTLLNDTKLGLCSGLISSVNWGELRYSLSRRSDFETADASLRILLSLGLDVVPASRERAERAGYLKETYKLGYADCFGVELAQDAPDHILITADYGVKPAESLIQIEFLPPK